MGRIKYPPKAKLIVAAMVASEPLFDEVRPALQKHFGPVDERSAVYPFTFSDYYDAEMGNVLHKQIFSFERIFDTSELAAIKIRTNEIEERFAEEKDGHRHRRINLDPGYVNDSKLVLASTKDFSHRIYIGSGIFAEVTLRYLRRQGFEPLEWTYPDYRTGLVRHFLEKVRQRYMKQVRGG